jgi:hypothetical protein
LPDDRAKTQDQKEFQKEIIIGTKKRKKTGLLLDSNVLHQDPQTTGEGGEGPSGE